MKTSELRCYDNGGKTFDQYTVIPPRWAGRDWARRTGAGIMWDAIGASDCPFSPQGFGQSCEAQAGPHLGKRVTFENLPPDVQRFAIQSFINGE